MNLEDARERLIKEYCGDPGIFDISLGNRFGDKVLAVYSISLEERERIVKLIPNPYEGYPVYFAGPIWSLGELIPSYWEKIKNIQEDPKYVTSGTAEWKVREALIKETIDAEKNLWDSVSLEAKREIIKQLILKNRKRDPGFANCGDKYLKPD